MNDLIPVLGTWFWWVAAAILLIVELMLPGFFFIWLAAAAVAMGIADALFGFGWQAELVLFALFSVVCVFIGKRVMSARRGQDSDRPNLNQRMYDYLGNTYVLEDPIVNGRGKVRIGDTIWEVTGPDLPRGARVKVAAVDNLRLRVEAA